MCVGGASCRWSLQQEPELWRPWQGKEEARRVLPSAEWRKERHARDRLPDYDSSKSNKGQSEAPLDMTTRRPELDRDRGSPPSYSQSVSQPGYRRIGGAVSPGTLPPPWPTVVRPCSRLSTVEQQADSTQPDHSLRKGSRKEFITGGGTSDPDIDEHFRRSLGEDYLNVFCKSSKRDEARDFGEDVKDDSKEMAAPSGLSVDDHFAKALGETWLKLQAESANTGNKPEKEPRRSPTAIKTVNGLTVAFPVKSPKSKDSNDISRQRRGLVSS